MRIYKLVFAVVFFVSYALFAQDPDVSLVQLGDEMYGFGDKKDALGVYLQAIEMNPNNAKANFMAGKCYLETIQKELSVNYLLKAYELDKNIAPDILFKIAMGYQLGAKFDEAISYYKQYKENLTEAKAQKINSSVKDEVIKTDRKIFECLNGKTYYATKFEYKIENLTDVINSEYPDYAPAVTADNQLLIFTSRRAGGVGKNKDVDNEYFEDIWYSRKINGEWASPKNMGKPINSETHDASIGISPDGKELFLYKPDNGGDIYVSKYQPNGTWSNPVSMGKVVNTRFNEPSVSISFDGKTLYFSSDRPGGFGGLDIYKAELDNSGNWSKPMNLGSTINTEYDEDSPFIDLDGKTLYFSSRGHKGMGGYDIYRSKYDDKRRVWSEPENMAYPINSPDDDIYFVITGDGKTGYFASAKGDGYGDKDIYVIYLDPKVEALRDSLKKIPEQKPIAKNDTEPTPAKKPTTTEPALEVTPQKNIVPNTTPKPTATTPVTTPKPDAVPPQNKPVNPSDNTNPTVTETNKIPAASVINTPKKEEVKTPAPLPAVVEMKPTLFKGRVYDYQTNTPMAANLVINDFNGNILKVIDVGEDGYFSTEISQTKLAKFSVTVTRDGYIYNNINVFFPANSKTQQVVKRDFYLRKVNVGEIFILRNIYYDFNKAVIKKESYPYLEKLVAWLKAHPNVHLEIGGHTDNTGMPEYNKILSQRRVDAVRVYLVAKGISPERLVSIGYGESRPLATNDDEIEGRNINRRTEFKITRQ